jgi:3-methyladenine DNA glycosylase AlkD
VRERLNAAVDPKFRKGQFAFFKEEIETYGVRRRALDPIIRELFQHIREWPAPRREQLYAELWKSGKLEEGVIVCHGARRFPREFGGRMWGVCEDWIDRYVRNWAHCDGVASWLLAGCIAEHPALMKNLEPWTGSPNRWKRRAAAVALLQEAKAGRATNQILRIAALLAEDSDDMVQKGVGWLLKEAYPAQPNDLTLFLHRQRDRFSPLTLRIAAEKMSDRHRSVLLRPRAITKERSAPA